MNRYRPFSFISLSSLHLSHLPLIPTPFSPHFPHHFILFHSSCLNFFSSPLPVRPGNLCSSTMRPSTDLDEALSMIGERKDSELRVEQLRKAPCDLLGYPKTILHPKHSSARRVSVLICTLPPTQYSCPFRSPSTPIATFCSLFLSILLSSLFFVPCFCVYFSLSLLSHLCNHLFSSIHSLIPLQNLSPNSLTSSLFHLFMKYGMKYAYTNQ